MELLLGPVAMSFTYSLMSITNPFGKYAAFPVNLGFLRKIIVIIQRGGYGAPKERF